MIPRDLHVLTTRHATHRDKELAGQAGIILHEMPLIRVSFVRPPAELLQVATAQRLPWVFTSRNGVEGCLQATKVSQVQAEPAIPARIYAVGPGTAEVANEWDVPVVYPEKANGTGLAERILQDSLITEVVHWCGNIRRPEMSQILQEAGLHVHEIIVYNTEIMEKALPPVVKPDAVLVYSPSAAETLLGNSQIPGWDCPFIAIGGTTAEALQRGGITQVYKASRPTPEAMIRMALQLNSVADV